MIKNSPLICISGGIGSGKSVVCRILRMTGHIVFDCDDEARRIMDYDPEIHKRIASEVEPAAVCGGIIDRKILAATVFNNPERLECLNSIVHKAVIAELLRRHETFAIANTGKPYFVETALLYQSGLNELVDAVWEVDAPAPLRTERVMQRNGLSRAEVEARIASQVYTLTAGTHIPPTIRIINDGRIPLLPQILSLI